jgi:folate-binding Fe-S cluster repair protein YgfZ
MSSASLPTAYTAARQHAAFARRTPGLVVLSGRDRASYLQGLLTNDIVALAAGQGCYSAYLTPQGRMITELWAYELGDVLLLRMPAAAKDTVLARLDQFIFSEDVQLGDLSDTHSAIVLVGPAAAEVASNALGLDGVALDGLPEHGNLRATARGDAVVVLRVFAAPAPRNSTTRPPRCCASKPAFPCSART